MNVGTLKYRLTPRQRHIAAQLARHFRGSDTPQGLWSPSSPNHIQIHNWTLHIEGGATKKDFDALAANRLLRCQPIEQNGLKITALSQLYVASGEGFGIPTRLRILQALVEMCVERKMSYASSQNIDELLGPMDNQRCHEIEAICEGELLSQRRIEFRLIGNEPFYRITDAGITEAEAEAASLEADDMEDRQQRHSQTTHAMGNTYPQLSPKQKLLLMAIVSAAKWIMPDEPEHVSYLWGRIREGEHAGEDCVYFNGHFIYRAALDDLRALEAVNLIKLNKGSTTYAVSMTPAGFLAMKERFGLTEEKIVLLAAYVLVEGKHKKIINRNEVGRYCGYTGNDVEPIVKRLFENAVSTGMLVQATRFDAHFFTIEGIAMMERPDEPAAKPSGESKTFHFERSNVAFHNGTGDICNFAQQINPDIQTLVGLIDSLRTDFAHLEPADRKEAEEALDALKHDVQVKPAKAAHIKGLLTVLFNFTRGSVAFMAMVDELCQKLCIAKVEILKLFHHP